MAAVATPVVLAVAVLVSRTPQVIIEPVPGDAPAALVEVPEAGEASAVWHGGVPVLVVNAGGGVYAVEAISPHRDLGIGDAVAWCRPAQVFVAAHGGDLFAPDGGYMGGPSPTGLPTYHTDVDGEAVSIGERRAPFPRPQTPATAGPADPDLTSPCLGRGADPAAVVQHDWPPDPGAVATVEEAVARGDATRVVVSGRLLVEGGGGARLCGLEGGPTECRGEALDVRGLDPLSHDLMILGYEGLWRVDVARGVATAITQVRAELEVVEPGADGSTPPPSPAFGPSDERTNVLRRSWHARMDAMESEEAARLRMALAMFEDGVSLMRQNLRRADPEASDDEIERRLGAWLRDRPGAEHGDGVGRPVSDRFA